MNEEVIVHRDGYIEKYNYFTINDRTPRPVPKTDGFDSADHGGLPYGVWIYPDAESGNISINIPEEMDGHPVSAAVIYPALKVNGRIILKRLYIPSTVRYLYIKPPEANEYETMICCTAEISPDNPYLCVYENGIYSRDMTELYYIFSPAEYFEVPLGVRKIKVGAGVALKGLRRLFIHESVTEIEEDAFFSCPDLEEADIRARVIRDHAFSRCEKLTAVRLPECETIGKGAFNFCKRLETVELGNAKLIDDNAFGFCSSLKEIRLPETLREIGNYAFSATGIKKLTIPPAARRIRHEVMTYQKPEGSVLEVYAKDGALPKMEDGSPAGQGTLLVVLSPETGGKLFELVIPENGKKVFTKQGICLEEYDNIFKEKFLYQGFSFKSGLHAAQVRLRWLNENDGEKREFFKQYISDAAFLIVMNSIIQYPNRESDGDITDGTYLDLVTDDDLSGLIDQAAHDGKPEVTARLLQYQHERKGRG